MPLKDSFFFTCRTCGERHVGIPDLAFDSPQQYHQLSEFERRRIATLTKDTCVIENEDHFIRGCLDIPIRGAEESFVYGVWVSLSKVNYQRYLQLFGATHGLPEEPFFGWFCNSLEGYPETLNLKTNVYLRPAPLRPRIALEPTDHPLAIEQLNGITEERLREIVERSLHGHAA